MNSNKVIVSGKNASTSVFITISESQKEQAERLEYEIRNSVSSTEEEEEAENDQYKIKKMWKQSKYCDDCGLDKNDECECDNEESDDDESEEIKHLKEVEVLKNEIDELKKQLNKKSVENINIQEQLDNVDSHLCFYFVPNINERSKYTTGALLQKVESCAIRKNQLDDENKSLKQTIRDLHTSLSKMTKQYNKQTIELKDERLFRRDNEDNFFRLLDKYNRCEKALKKVQV